MAEQKRWADLNLLPRKAFEILFKEIVDGKEKIVETIKGQFTSWSVKRYCDRKKLSLSKLGEQLSSDNLSMDDTSLLILCAVEYVSRKAGEQFNYTDINCCDWIDEMGGWGSEKLTQLLAHSASDMEDSGEDEKKNQLNGQTSKLSASEQG